MKLIFLYLSSFLFVITYGISQDLPPYVPTEGLIGYWPFDGNANDISGNNLNGIVNGATLTTDRSGNIESAYFFDESAWIETSESFSISAQNVSVCAWFYCNNDVTSMSAQIISVNTSQSEHSLQIEISENNALYFNALPFDETITPPNTFEYDSWNFVVGTFDGATETIYVNGQKVIEKERSGDFSIIDQKINFGRQTFASTDYWYGKIDDVGIWNRALTEQEIQNLYTSSAGDIILNGIVSAENNQIKNVADPTEGKDAVNKDYLEVIISALESRIEQLENSGEDNSEEGIPSNVSLNGLLAYYPLDGNGQDKTDFQNHMNMVGQVTYTTDHNGDQEKAANFTNSINGYFELPETSWTHLNALPSGSVSFWIKLDQKFVSNHYFNFGNSFMVKQKNGVGQDFFVGLSDGTTKVMFYLSGIFPQSSENYIIGNTSLSLDTWYNITVTWNGSNQKLYVNGTLDGFLEAGYDGVPDRTDIDYFSIGSSLYGTNTGVDNEVDAGAYGSMDNIAFWNRELSLNEVNSLYNGN